MTGVPGRNSSTRRREACDTAEAAVTRCPARFSATASAVPTRPAPTTPTSRRAGCAVSPAWLTASPGLRVGSKVISRQVPRFVQPDLTGAWHGDSGQVAKACLRHRPCELNPFSRQLGHRLGYVVAH